MSPEERGNPLEVPTRIDFLDGLRGFAALYVVLHHAALMVTPTGMSRLSASLRFILRHGHYAVSLFVVLSGYCLMLRVLAGSDGRLPGGTLAYLGRRARRILPPYYAALGFCGVLIVMVPALGRPDQTPWDRALPAFAPGSIVAHLLLVHNLDGGWIFRIAPPFWSLATEWQAFLLFPALLAIWRRWGITSALATALIIGEVIAGLSLPLQQPALRVLCPWYLGLLAMGMMAALVSRAARPFRFLGAEFREHPKWMMTILSTTVLTWWLLRSTAEAYVMTSDLIVGAAIAALVVRWAWLSAKADANPSLPRPWILRFFESRGLVAAGTLSYSLYLTHYPILALANLTLRESGWSANARQTALVLFVSPFCVLVADLFHRIFERSKAQTHQPSRAPMLAPAGNSGLILSQRFSAMEGLAAHGLLRSDSLEFPLENHYREKPRRRLKRFSHSRYPQLTETYLNGSPLL